MSSHTPTPPPRSHLLAQFYRDNVKKPLFVPITGLVTALIAYIFGITALLLLAWRGGSRIFSRSWLTKVAAKPLLVTPSLGRWALFLGYERRLLVVKQVKEAAQEIYFGLPALDPDDYPILPDEEGKSLHERITRALGPQQPVVVAGKGGAGKSTLLGRWVFLALNGGLPSELKRLRPVLVTADFYSGDLVKAITDTLLRRDGIAVTKDVMRAQLSSGGYLVLFDGVSEVEGDPPKELDKILGTARSAEYQNCRFLITTRPLRGMPAEIVFHLQPLRVDRILELLPRYGLGQQHAYYVRRQLAFFGEKPVEPLLLSMVLQQGEDAEISRTRAGLYERYFRRLLLGERKGDKMAWRGWQKALETLAQWFMLDTGRRGLGLPHERLLDKMAAKDDDAKPSLNLVERVNRYYDLPVKSELDLLQKLEAAGVLEQARRWRFAHDTFEEYFSASRVVSHYAEQEEWLRLDPWMNDPDLERAFLDVLAFVREMIDARLGREMVKADIPESWIDALTG